MTRLEGIPPPDWFRFLRAIRDLIFLSLTISYEVNAFRGFRFDSNDESQRFKRIEERKKKEMETQRRKMRKIGDKSLGGKGRGQRYKKGGKEAEREERENG